MGGKDELILTTHIDKGHIHNHLIFNAVSFANHKQYHSNKSRYHEIRWAIDRLIPVSSSLEDLLPSCSGKDTRSSVENISPPGRQTRNDSHGSKLWVPITRKKPFISRITGGPRHSRQPRQRKGKVSLLIGIQNNIKAQQSAGYQQWATIENLKRAAATMNFLTEHGIGNYEEMEEQCNTFAAASIRTRGEPAGCRTTVH